MVFLLLLRLLITSLLAVTLLLAVASVLIAALWEFVGSLAIGFVDEHPSVLVLIPFCNPWLGRVWAAVILLTIASLLTISLLRVSSLLAIILLGVASLLL